MIHSLFSEEETNSFTGQEDNNVFLEEINTLKDRIVLRNSRNLNWVTY